MSNHFSASEFFRAMCAPRGRRAYLTDRFAAAGVRGRKKFRWPWPYYWVRSSSFRFVRLLRQVGHSRGWISRSLTRISAGIFVLRSCLSDPMIDPILLATMSLTPDRHLGLMFEPWCYSAEMKRNVYPIRLPRPTCVRRCAQGRRVKQYGAAL